MIFSWLPERITFSPWVYFKSPALETLLKRLGGLFIQNMPVDASVITSFYNPIKNKVVSH